LATTLAFPLGLTQDSGCAATAAPRRENLA
jgi:hypothetical protein